MTDRLPRAQKIAVICHGAYLVNAQSRYIDKDGKEQEVAWSGNFPVGETRVFDLSKASNIATGSKIWPKISAVAGYEAVGSPVEYAPNGHTMSYVAKGITLNPWLEIL
jgi:hypothetical protein